MKDLSAFSDAIALSAGVRPTADFHPAAEGLQRDVVAIERLAGFFTPQGGRGGAGPIQAFLSSSDLADLITGTVRRVVSDSSRFDVSHRRLAALASAPNFKPMTLMRALGSELVHRPHGSPAVPLALSAAQEQVSVETYSGTFAFTREAALGTAWDALVGATGELVAGAYRAERSMLIDLFNANPVMSDGIAQFHSDRANVYIGELSAEALGAAIATLKALPGADGKPLQTQASVLLCPAAREMEAAKLIKDAGLSIEVVGDSRMGTASYLLSEPRRSPAYTILHLDGQRSPVVSVKANPRADVWTIKAVFDIAVAATSTRAVRMGP